MKKLTYLFLAILIVACSDDEDSPCVYSPTLVTDAATNVTETTATLNGVISIVSENCEDPTNTEQGFVYATTIQPTINNTQVNIEGTDITTTLENLEPNTTYYVRTFLTNALGEFYGNAVAFTTSEELVCVYNLNTQDVTNITTTSVVLNGTIITEDIENCELPDTEQGFVYSTEVQPTIADTQVNVNGTDVSTILENLEPNTTYYVRTFLTNSFGVFYGNEISFMTEAICDIIYLAENGITIKACDDANIGDVGEINGISYTVVDEAILREMVANEEDITKVVTTYVDNMFKLFFIDLDTPTDFNQDISSWDVSNVTNMSYMFTVATIFNQDISFWDVSNVTSMSVMFAGTNFNQPIGNWEVSNVIYMGSMFEGANFNQPIRDWDVSSVTNMDSMFSDATSFNQPIGDWDVSSVTSMDSMFSDATSFNQPIENWDVSTVTNMGSMFANADAFNQPIGDWDVSNVTDMGSMFVNADAFNQPIGDWVVSNVTFMRAMFAYASSFNQILYDWDVSTVANMQSMFNSAISFNQDLANWNVINVNECDGFDLNTPQWTLFKPNLNPSCLE